MIVSSILQRVVPIFHKKGRKARTENLLCYPAFHTVLATDESLMTCSSLNGNRKFVLMTSMMTSQRDVIKIYEIERKLTINGPFLTDKSNWMHSFAVLRISSFSFFFSYNAIKMTCPKKYIRIHKSQLHAM